VLFSALTQALLANTRARTLPSDSLQTLTAERLAGSQPQAKPGRALAR
jgi:hypothetical protein